MPDLNQINFYQLENLVLQRVNFTLLDLTKESEILEGFKHLNIYYQNFLKQQIQKSDAESYRSNSVFVALSKESPIVVVCDNGLHSKDLASELEKEQYLNVFYLEGGAAGSKES